MLLPLGVTPIAHVGVTALLGFAVMLATVRFLLPHAVDSGGEGHISSCRAGVCWCWAPWVSSS